jgi:hypothetical protein
LEAADPWRNALSAGGGCVVPEVKPPAVTEPPAPVPAPEESNKDQELSLIQEVTEEETPVTVETDNEEELTENDEAEELVGKLYYTFTGINLTGNRNIVPIMN